MNKLPAKVCAVIVRRAGDPVPFASNFPPSMALSGILVKAREAWGLIQDPTDYVLAIPGQRAVPQLAWRLADITPTDDDEGMRWIPST